MSVQLNDRLTKRDGWIVTTGVQALVRLMLLQGERDRAAGRNTGGFVSGYRGSPLGTLDMAFASAEPLPNQLGIRVMPAVNEELAATAIAGTQQIEQTPGAKVQGVFALWYAKGPGVDRAADAIRHGNTQGSSPLGGVVLAVGDDHAAKSSSLACYSDDTLVSLRTPIFYPADPREIVTLGLHGFEASRVSGSWIALKVMNEIADSTRAVPADELKTTSFVSPEVKAPQGGLHNRWPITALQQEMIQMDFRLPAVQAYVRANKLDRVVLKEPSARLGIVAAGKSWQDVVEALRLLGLDETRQREIGLALYKPAMIWPLEPETLDEFAAGLEQIIVVEEKDGLMEAQIKSRFYGRPNAPAVYGKHRADGTVMFPQIADLTPERIAAELGAVAQERGVDLGNRLARVMQGLSVQAEFAVPPVIRTPFFCSGCPHNRGTNLPEGSRATAGIGCHGLASWNRKDTSSFSQMGGEGIHWVGLAPFTDEQHMFANLGDGTYFHSGILAIRQAVAAKTNITYKILYNSAVAMTGGQSVDGELSVTQLVQQLRAEGVETVLLVTDKPENYPSSDPVRQLVAGVEHRDELEAVQRRLRDRPGVSVIVYEQMCANEKRRLRKRGKMAEPDTRVFINDLVCEGCGDCSVKSNCLSVEPLPTEFGMKRRINQSSCNKDYSCLNGFCPSFVTVQGATVRKRRVSTVADSTPLPAPPLGGGEHQRIVVAGVGGTGVVTIGALLSMSGHLSGQSVAVLDQLGGAQKGGAVTSHIHVGGGAAGALRIPAGEADLVLACDQVVGNFRDVVASIDRERTYVLANADVTITGEFTTNPSAIADSTFLARRLGRNAGEGRFYALPFTRLAERLLGDAIGSNLMMVGMAYQKGWLPLDLATFNQAIELNGVGVKMNQSAFEWGRRLATDPESVFKAAGLVEPEPETLDALVARRTEFLADYQDRAYADRFVASVNRVREAEARVSQGHELTEAVTRSLFKLMAYKDEYEVGRLYRSDHFRKAIAEQFEGEFKMNFHMAPPIIAKRDKVTGHLRKQKFGAWMMPAFGVLSKLRGLRGTPLDLFGYTAERKMERALIAEYEALIGSLLTRLSPANHGAITELARLPMDVRGYGHVKDKAVASYREAVKTRLAALDQPQADDSARPLAVPA